MNNMKGNKKSLYRKDTWSRLKKVAYPDSRFGWDFNSFIPDYEGSDLCAKRILELTKGNESLDNWLITPDNNLDILREELIKKDIPFIMPTYGIKRGFLYLDPLDVPKNDEAFASTLDGMNKFAERIKLEVIEKEVQKIDVMVTGCSFVTEYGLRIGKGHGFFDLEWAMMKEIGKVDENTKVIVSVHNYQVIKGGQEEEIAEEHDTIADYIVTPTDTIKASTIQNKPQCIFWDMLDQDKIEEIPPLKKLWNRK